MRAAPELDYKSWERLESAQVIPPNDFCRWMHLATIIDAEKSEMRHYVNGRRVARGPLQRHTPVQLGTANLGNLDATWNNTQPARNFNGRIDEFEMFSRVLSDQEIASQK